MGERRGGTRWRWRAPAIAAAVALLGAVGLFAAAGFFDSNPDWFFASRSPRPRYVAILLSGDMGLRFGLGGHIAVALRDAGVPVLGLSSSTEFASRKDRAQVDAFVADAVHRALARTGARQAILIGQSFGADIARVGLAHFPRDQRAQLAAAVLVVPGATAFFRADPSGFTYRGAPDAGPAEAAAIDWLPLFCIRGAAETDSLCPRLKGANIRSVTLPGGHFLQRNHGLLTQTVMGALAPILREVHA